MADNQFENVDKLVFNTAGALDGLLRVFAQSAPELSELEQDYLKNWLNKEKDPLLGTVLAQLAGFREVTTPERQDGDDD